MDVRIFGVSGFPNHEYLIFIIDSEIDAPEKTVPLPINFFC